MCWVKNGGSSESRSVVSDSSWRHGLQPTRLLRPWDFPGKSTGVGCHCLLQKRSLALPFCCFLLLLSTVHWRSASCLFCLFFGTLHLIECIFPSLPCFSFHFVLLRFIRPPQITTLPSCFSFLWMVLFAISCTILWTPVHSSLRHTVNQI